MYSEIFRVLLLPKDVIYSKQTLYARLPHHSLVNSEGTYLLMSPKKKRANPSTQLNPPAVVNKKKKNSIHPR